MGDVARWEGAKENVPLLVARQGSLREVRASNDDGGNAPLVEEIPFCVKVSLVNACFNVGIFEQLPERVGIVEAEIRRCENAPLDSPLSQLREYFGEHLNSAGRDECDRKIEAYAIEEFSFDNGEHIACGIVVAENARRKAVVGLLLGSDEACFEALSESGLRFFRKLDNVAFNALIHGCLDGVGCVFEDNHTRENVHVARFGGFRQYGIVGRRWV